MFDNSLLKILLALNEVLKEFQEFNVELFSLNTKKFF